MRKRSAMPAASSASTTAAIDYWGYGLAVSGAILFSTKGIFIKLAYQHGVATETVLALRMLVALPVYLVILATLLRRNPDLAEKLKPRLILPAMAVGLLHEPEILFLDEPTSGADPLARRGFWQRITALAAGGTTIIITTHFMEEAEYCDRIVIQDAGRILAMGTPQQVREQAGGQGSSLNMEQAFIEIVEQARQHQQEARA